MNKQKLITVILNLITRKNPWGLFSGIIHSYKFETFFFFFLVAWQNVHKVLSTPSHLPDEKR